VGEKFLSNLAFKTANLESYLMKSKTHVVDMTNWPQSKENNLEKNGIRPTFKKKAL